jgi:hypothetical protein
VDLNLGKQTVCRTVHAKLCAYLDRYLPCDLLFLDTDGAAAFANFNIGNWRLSFFASAYRFYAICAAPKIDYEYEVVHQPIPS